MTTRKGHPRSGESPTPCDRRTFLSALGAAAPAAIGAIGAAGTPEAEASAPPPGGATAFDRREEALRVRVEMARFAHDRPVPSQAPNGEEDDYPGVASFTKTLPHDRLGQVDPAAWAALLAALQSGRPEDFESIPSGMGRPLVNPQAGLSFDLQGPDSHHLSIPPAPRIDGAEVSGEMAELYWMALLRDLPFVAFRTDRDVESAARELTRMRGFLGPRDGRRVTPDTIFRGMTRGDVTGPFVSQFLLWEVPYGSLRIDQRQRTAVPGVDFMTDVASWLGVQDGAEPGPEPLDPTRRYIRSMRDLGRYVHVDALYQAYLNAALILAGLGAPVDSGNPYVGARRQIGFGTFGDPHLLSLVTEVATRALKAVWFQKWYVHRRLRPEEFSGRIHHLMTGAAQYPIHREILRTEAADRVFRRQGTWLLPMAFPEGSPPRIRPTARGTRP